MAAWATHPVLERLSAAGLDPRRYVYSTEKVFGEHSASVLARYLAAIGEESAPCLMVGGYSCADFVAGLEVAEMMCARGGSPVVLVTTDALEAGRSRVYRDLAVVSNERGRVRADQPAGGAELPDPLHCPAELRHHRRHRVLVDRSAGLRPAGPGGHGPGAGRGGRSAAPT